MGRELLSSILRAMQAPSPTRLAQSTQEEYSHVIECRNRRPGADAQAVVRGVRGDARQPGQHRCRRPRQPAAPLRSEEHTSELQSLMRISYAVFCLKKKKKKHKTQHEQHSTQ